MAIWQESLLPQLCDFLKENAKEAALEPKKPWSWLKNPRCKYIDIRIDMRDGGFILKDRDGNNLKFDELLLQ